MNQYENTIKMLLNDAERLIAANQLKEGIKRFKILRELLTAGVEQEQMDAMMKRVRHGFAHEARRYMQGVKDHFPTEECDRKVVVLSSSLAIPRPEEMKREDMGLELAFPFWLQSYLLDKKYKVLSWGESYMTTRLLLQKWEEIAEETGGFDGAHIIIHLGINDFVERMFLEEGRIAMDVLQKELKERIIAFTQIHRHLIIQNQNEYSYVPSAEFMQNLELIALRLKNDGARSVSFVTQVAVPADRWRFTPNYMFYLTRCNLAIYTVAKNLNLSIIDLDRFIWSHGHAPMMNSDLMHLGHEGHKAFADKLAHHILSLDEGK